MTDDSITFGAAQSDIAPGTYNVTLTAISEARTQTAQRGPRAGQDFTIRDWTFYTDDDQEIRDSASISKSTRGKQYQWVMALLGGTPPPVDQPIRFDQLIGREAIATVELNEDGWPKITVLSALPKQRAKPAAGASPAAAARAAAAQAPAAVADATSTDLPF